MAEFRKFHVPNLLTEYENSGLLVFHFPIEDGMVPEDVLGLVRIFLLKKECSYYVHMISYTVDVLWGQPIKLAQVASTTELLENQRNDLVFIKIIPSHFCRASEASKIDCFKN